MHLVYDTYRDKFTVDQLPNKLCIFVKGEREPRDWIRGKREQQPINFGNCQYSLAFHPLPYYFSYISDEISIIFKSYGHVHMKMQQACGKNKLTLRETKV